MAIGKRERQKNGIADGRTDGRVEALRDSTTERQKMDLMDGLTDKVTSRRTYIQTH